MKIRIGRLARLASVVLACSLAFAAGRVSANAWPQETVEGGTYTNGDIRVEILFDGLARGVPVDVGVMTFPPGLNSGDHQHEQTEIFYVLDGTLEHRVNGEPEMLDPGMLGHVKPPDFVNHVTPEGGGSVRALVMWSPAGAAARYGRIWTRVTGSPPTPAGGAVTQP